MSVKFLQWLDTMNLGAGQGDDAAQEGVGALPSLGNVPGTGTPTPTSGTGTQDPTGPAPQTLSTPHDSGDPESMGSKFLKMLPMLAAGGAAAFAAHKDGGMSGLEAVGHLTKGHLDMKLNEQLEKKKTQNEMDNFLVKAAYGKVDALNGKDLSGVKIPDGLKNRLIELHKKANEARMNDGIVTPKEAQEILALAGPIEQELEAAKTEQGSPTYQAGEKEKGVQAGFDARDAATGNAPGSSYKNFADSQSMVPVPGHPELGMVPKSQAVKISQDESKNKMAQQKIDASIQRAIQTDARVRARFSQGVNGSDTRAFNASLASMKSRIASAVNQAATANQVMPGTPQYDQLVDAITQEQLKMDNTIGGPAMQGKPPGPAPSRPNVKRVTRDASGNLVLQ